MKILFTGFDPFGGDKINPSWEAVKLLPDTIGGAQIAKLHLPVGYSTVRPLLHDAIVAEQPDVVVCVGQAGGRATITPEMVAVNIMDASIADNEGVLCTGEPVVSAGPAAYFATLPVKRMVKAMQQAAVPASVSYTAGTYVCNSTMYHLMDMIAAEFPGVRGGFVHIPFLCEQTVGRSASMASLPLETMVKGLTAIAEAVQDEGDAEGASGYTH